MEDPTEEEIARQDAEVDGKKPAYTITGQTGLSEEVTPLVDGKLDEHAELRAVLERESGDELRERLKALGLKASGKKSELRARIIEAQSMTPEEQLLTLSVKALRDRLEEYGLKVSGTKAELVERLLAIPNEPAETLEPREPAIDPTSDDHPLVAGMAESAPAGACPACGGDVVEGSCSKCGFGSEAPAAHGFDYGPEEARKEEATGRPHKTTRPPPRPRERRHSPITPDPRKCRTLPPRSEFSTVAAIFEQYQKRENWESKTLPVGQLAHECERRIWYKFRWALPTIFEGRALRMFDRGHREEEIVVDELRSIGLEVWATREDVQGAPHFAHYANGQWHVFDGAGAYVSSHGLDQTAATNEARKKSKKQIRAIAVDGHLGGRLDAVVRGLKEAPKTPHVLEVKNLNDKRMKALEKKGLEEAEPLHFGQLVVYMRIKKLTRGVYIASGKNDQRFYLERVRIEDVRGKADELLEKAKRIVEAYEPPDRISRDPTFFKCRFCDYHTTCHGIAAPRKSCRTCVHSTPVVDGSGRGTPAWICEHGGGAYPIDFDRQEIGCNSHLFIPGLLEPVLEYIGADQMNSAPKFVEYSHPSGVVVRNIVESDGFPQPGAPVGFTSSELHSNPIDFSTDFAKLRGDLDEIPF